MSGSNGPYADARQEGDVFGDFGGTYPEWAGICADADEPGIYSLVLT